MLLDLHEPGTTLFVYYYYYYCCRGAEELKLFYIECHRSVTVINTLNCQLTNRWKIYGRRKMPDNIAKWKFMRFIKRRTKIPPVEMYVFFFSIFLFRYKYFFIRLQAISGSLHLIKNVCNPRASMSEMQESGREQGPPVCVGPQPINMLYLELGKGRCCWEDCNGHRRPFSVSSLATAMATRHGV